MSDSLPDPQADVEHLLVQTLEEEERRLAELEARVSRLSSGPQPRASSPSDEATPPADPSVTQSDLAEARSLLAQSGEHLRQLQGRLTELESGPPSASEDETPLPAPPREDDSTDRFQLVLGPGQGASVEPALGRDSLEVNEAPLPRESSAGAREPLSPPQPSGPPAHDPSVPPVTSRGWGESTPLPAPAQAGVPRPTNGFRSAEVMPSADEVDTPSTSSGWGGVPEVAPPTAHTVQSEWGRDPDPHADPLRAEVFVPFEEEERQPESEVLHEPPPSSDLLAIQVPTTPPAGDPRPTIEPPEVRPPVVLPPPANAIQFPNASTPGYLVSAGPAAVAGQVAAAAHAAHADRFDLGNKFGAGREPALRELWQNQQQILKRLERVAEQVGDLAQAQANEVHVLQARAERAERVCAQALGQAQSRALRWESAVSGLTSRAELQASGSAPADALPGATQQLVRLLRDAINAQPDSEPAHVAEPPKPDRFEVLRERLFAMGSEHQTLVSRHATLLEDLLGLLDAPAEE